MGWKCVFGLFLCVCSFVCIGETPSVGVKDGEAGSVVETAAGVLSRFSPEVMQQVRLEYISTMAPGTFEATVQEGILLIRGATGVDLCRGFYTALRQSGRGINSWTGKRFERGAWKPMAPLRGRTPFQWRYFFNAVTFGYTTAFWDWSRWEAEIDRLAMWGVNFPLALTGQEAVMAQVYQEMGLTEEEIGASFCGPAHLPWLRMGNIEGIDAPLPMGWHASQVTLQQQILMRMRQLGMEPIVPGFSGVVSEAFVRHYPQAQVMRLNWGGQKRFNTVLLHPADPLFKELTKRYIRAWEATFGPCQYWLIDLFNEMPIPPELDVAALAAAVNDALSAADADGVWVMQGWMFGYQRHIWDANRVQQLLSRVPNERMVLLDLAADYTALLWRQTPTHQYYDGFYGKRWVNSYIPNMGGKTGYTGNLAFYATHVAQIASVPVAQRPVGFGVAPEGLENNEVIYELLADCAWSPEGIDLLSWLRQYTQCRYGCYPEQMDAYWQALLAGPYGSFTDHPRFAWQGRSGRVPETIDTRHTEAALRALVACAPVLKGNPLYEADLRELGAIVLGAVKPTPDFAWMDALLEGHPTHRLATWLAFAKATPGTPAEQAYYERSARRLVTTWGPGVEDYSARLWSGLIRDYYAPRYRLEKAGASREALATFEANWVEQVRGCSPANDASEALNRLIRHYASLATTGAPFSLTEGNQSQKE